MPCLRACFISEISRTLLICVSVGSCRFVESWLLWVMVSALHLCIPLVPLADQFALLTHSYVGACGKTSLLCSFALGEFPKEYVSRRLCHESATSPLFLYFCGRALILRCSPVFCRPYNSNRVSSFLLTTLPRSSDCRYSFPSLSYFAVPASSPLLLCPCLAFDAAFWALYPCSVF